MAFQAGDVVAFAKLAWNVYQLGWSDDSNATRQYCEFGRDVRNLASSLDILAKVVAEAQNSLVLSSSSALSPVSRATPQLRWDPASLIDIIGDYEQTLRECHAVLHENRRYEGPVGPARTIKFNILVQPTVDCLRMRIQLHNSKVLHVLKPFEIDLLSRIRQDIAQMHSHLNSQIRAMHADLRRLIGVLVPDLDHELRMQTRRDIQLVLIPEVISRRFAQAAARSTTLASTAPSLAELRELADAFVAHWENSTVRFVGGLLVEARIPPVDTWLALLKCVWLMDRMRICVEVALEGSHWPSYIRQLEDELSTQCHRVGSEVIAPDAVALELAPAELFEIWPRAPPPDLVEVVTPEEALELVLELPLRSSTATVERSVKLLRRPTPATATPRRFRVVVTGIDRSTSPVLTQVETLNFDARSARLNPLYVDPTPSVFSVPEMVLRNDERIARLAFNDMRDLLMFQQGITGYQTWAGAVFYNVVANFVIANRKEPIREKSSIQLWRYKALPGTIVNAADNVSIRQPTLLLPPSPASSVNFSAVSSPVSIPRRESLPVTGGQFPRAGFDVGAGLGLGSSPPGRFGMAVPNHATITGLPFSSSPPRRTTFPVLPPTPGSATGTAQSVVIPRTGMYPTSLASPPLPSPAPSPNHRSMSISSGSLAAYGAPSVRSTNSNASDTYTIPVSLGQGTVGTLYKAPPHPVMVIFTQNPTTGRPAIVAIRIDQDTAVNPERCNCRQSGKSGTECPITAVERNKGKEKMMARRFESTGRDAEWPLAEFTAALADGSIWTRADDDDWKNLVRVSFLFENGPKDRAAFGGTPNVCRCKAKRDGEVLACLKAGHGGQYGEVRELRRRQMLEFHDAKYQNQKHNVVHGRRDDIR